MNLKLYHFAILYLSVIIFFTIEKIWAGFILLYKFIELIFYDADFALSQLSFSMVDVFISSIMIITILFFFMIKRKKLGWLNLNISLSGVVVVVILSFFIFAPVIAPFNPDFQKNISVTKLLKPLESKIRIEMFNQNKSITNIKEKFLELKINSVLNTFNSNIIYADSLDAADQFYYYQGKQKKIINTEGKSLKEFCSIGESLFLFGTDEYGRDIFSRIIYGTRVSLFIGLTAVLITFVLGISLGFIAGYKGGVISLILNHTTDMFLAFPVIFLIILILSLFGGSVLSVIVVLGISGWMSLFKIVRSEVIAIKSKDYFLSAKQIGLSASALMKEEIFPVILTSVIVNLVFQFGNVILAESALSYLGLGAGNSYPSWGKMIEDGQSYLSQAWWMIVFPSLILIFTLYSANDIAGKINSSLKKKLEL
jgi:peptide/nickel transport system permease protein